MFVMAIQMSAVQQTMDAWLAIVAITRAGNGVNFVARVTLETTMVIVRVCFGFAFQLTIVVSGAPILLFSEDKNRHALVHEKLLGMVVLRRLRDKKCFKNHIPPLALYKPISGRLSFCCALHFYCL